MDCCVTNRGKTSAMSTNQKVHDLKTVKQEVANTNTPNIIQDDNHLKTTPGNQAVTIKSTLFACLGTRHTHPTRARSPPATFKSPFQPPCQRPVGHDPIHFRSLLFPLHLISLRYEESNSQILGRSYPPPPSDLALNCFFSPFTCRSAFQQPSCDFARREPVRGRNLPPRFAFEAHLPSQYQRDWTWLDDLQNGHPRMHVNNIAVP